MYQTVMQLLPKILSKSGRKVLVRRMSETGFIQSLTKIILNNDALALSSEQSLREERPDEAGDLGFVNTEVSNTICCSSYK